MSPYEVKLLMLPHSHRRMASTNLRKQRILACDHSAVRRSLALEVQVEDEGVDRGSAVMLVCGFASHAAVHSFGS